MYTTAAMISLPVTRSNQKHDEALIVPRPYPVKRHGFGSFGFLTHADEKRKIRLKLLEAVMKEDRKSSLGFALLPGIYNWLGARGYMIFIRQKLGYLKYNKICCHKSLCERPGAQRA